MIKDIVPSFGSNVFAAGSDTHGRTMCTALSMTWKVY